MTTEQKIQNIYDVIEPTFMDCFPWDDRLECESVLLIWDVFDWMEKNNTQETCCVKCYSTKWMEYRSDDEWYCKNCNEKSNSVYTDRELIYLWTTKREPIEKQTEQCIDFVYSLLSLTQE